MSETSIFTCLSIEMNRMESRGRERGRWGSCICHFLMGVSTVATPAMKLKPPNSGQSPLVLSHISIRRYKMPISLASPVFALFVLRSHSTNCIHSCMRRQHAVHSLTQKVKKVKVCGGGNTKTHRRATDHIFLWPVIPFSQTPDNSDWHK